MTARLRRLDFVLLLILLGAGVPTSMLLADSSRPAGPPREVRSATVVAPAPGASLVVTVQVIPAPQVPLQFALTSNYPNPFHASMSFRIDCPIEGHVAVLIFSATGRRVMTLLDDEIPAGTQTLVWNGRDDEGSMAPSGVYFYRMVAGPFVKTRKAILVR